MTDLAPHLVHLALWAVGLGIAGCVVAVLVIAASMLAEAVGIVTKHGDTLKGKR